MEHGPLSTDYSYIDIHAHLDAYEPEVRADVLARMREHATGAITIGTDPASSRQAVEIAHHEDAVAACVGVHPDHATGTDLHELATLAADPGVVAIGECGFDYFRVGRSEVRKLQQGVFEHQIALALEHAKPLMLHLRPSPGSTDAYDDALDLLEQYARAHGEALTGNAHFFAGSLEHARRFLDIGFTLSFTGVITFTHDYDEVVRFLPQDMIHAETDSPFVTPVPHRGTQNEPSYVRYVVEQLAVIRGEDPEELGRALVDNARRCF
ncbi:MAG: TatD family hydrolase, partial [Candidatus Paceibacterota bacterium]